MENSFYLNRAEELLKSFDSAAKKDVPPGEIVNIGLRDVERDFIHLVFAFDKDIPLLSELRALYDNSSLLSPYSGESYQDHVSKFRKLIEFFIHYQKEYI